MLRLNAGRRRPSGWANASRSTRPASRTITTGTAGRAKRSSTNGVAPFDAAYADAPFYSQRGRDWRLRGPPRAIPPAPHALDALPQRGARTLQEEGDPEPKVQRFKELRFSEYIELLMRRAGVRHARQGVRAGRVRGGLRRGAQAQTLPVNKRHGIELEDVMGTDHERAAPCPHFATIQSDKRLGAPGNVISGYHAYRAWAGSRRRKSAKSTSSSSTQGSWTAVGLKPAHQQHAAHRHAGHPHHRDLAAAGSSPSRAC